MTVVQSSNLPIDDDTHAVDPVVAVVEEVTEDRELVGVVVEVDGDDSDADDESDGDESANEVEKDRVRRSEEDSALAVATVVPLFLSSSIAAFAVGKTGTDEFVRRWIENRVDRSNFQFSIVIEFVQTKDQSIAKQIDRVLMEQSETRVLRVVLPMQDVWSVRCPMRF